MLVVRKIGEQIDEHGVRRYVLQDEYGGTILATHTEIASEIRHGELKIMDSKVETSKVKQSETKREEHLIKAKCISKNRDNNGVIKSYTLQDVNGKTMNVTGQQIKQAITNGQIEIINLQIDRAGRLIDKPVDCKEKTSNISIEQQTEIFIKFIQEARKLLEAEDFHFETKNHDAEKQILSEAAKRYPNKQFTCNFNTLVNKNRYSPNGKVNWSVVGISEDEVYINKLFANFIFGNIKNVSICVFDAWYGRHAEELVEEGDYTYKEMKKLVEEENKEYCKVMKKAKEFIEKYKRAYNMQLDYEIDSGYITITGVSFK